MRPRRASRRAWVVLLAALLGVAVATRLGAWQLSRAAQKQALQAALDTRAALPPLDAEALATSPEGADAQHYRRVTLRGRWIDGRSVFLENRPMDGRVGFIVVTPLQLEREAGAVLVQRGWAPRDNDDRSRVPALPAAPGVVEVEGLIAPPPGRLLALGGEGSGAIRQNLDLEALARETGLELRPLTVLQADAAPNAGDGLRRHWPQPAVDIHKHHGYAFQWFALAALIAGLYVWFQLVRPRRSA